MARQTVSHCQSVLVLVLSMLQFEKVQVQTRGNIHIMYVTTYYIATAGMQLEYVPCHHAPPHWHTGRGNGMAEHRLSSYLATKVRPPRPEASPAGIWRAGVSDVSMPSFMWPALCVCISWLAVI